MSEHKNLKIAAFVGLQGSRVDTIIEHLTSNGLPKVSRHDIVSQINHLQDAGQHRIITSELDSLDLYKTMKHQFPGELVVIALVVNHPTRLTRLHHSDSTVIDDWSDEQTDKAAVIGMADYFILDNEQPDATIERVRNLLGTLGF